MDTESLAPYHSLGPDNSIATGGSVGHWGWHGPGSDMSLKLQHGPRWCLRGWEYFCFWWQRGPWTPLQSQVALESQNQIWFSAASQAWVSPCPHCPGQWVQHCPCCKVALGQQHDPRWWPKSQSCARLSMVQWCSVFMINSFSFHIWMRTCGTFLSVFCLFQLTCLLAPFMLLQKTVFHPFSWQNYIFSCISNTFLYLTINGNKDWLILTLNNNSWECR